MISGMLLGLLIGLVLPLPDEIHACWKSMTTREAELPAPPVLVRQDSALFNIRVDVSVYPTTTPLYRNPEEIPRALSTALARTPTPSYRGDLPSARLEGIERDMNNNSWITWLFLCCRTDSPSRRSDR